jgi:MFS family permease
MTEAFAPQAVIRRLAVARFISFGGTQAAYIALIALVYERSNGSGVWISAALVAALGARVAASPWAGSLGDYFDRRWVMIGSDVAAAACFVAISQAKSLPLLVALAGVAAVAEAPFGPASGGLVAMLVAEDRRGWANGSLQSASAAGTVLGAAFGGVLVAGLGASTAFLANAVSFVASAALASTIGGHFASNARHEPEHRGVLRGMRLLATEPVLRLSAVGIALVCLGLGMMNVAELPFFVAIGAGKVGFGIAVAAWGGGQVAGGRLAARIVDARLERRALIFGCAIVSTVVAVSGTVPVFVVVALLFALGGLGNTLLNIAVVLMVQRWSPVQLQSRTLAAVEALANTSIGVSLLVGGALLGPLGARGIFVLAGGLGCIAVALAARIPRQPGPILPDLQPASGEPESTDIRGSALRPLPA